jgi:hypothetical protein
MNNCLPWDTTPADADGGETAPAAAAQVVRRLIVVMLLIAAALDLTRCSLAMAAIRHPVRVALLVAVGLATAALTARTARGCRAGRRWARWAALLIGAASAPQAAASGFRSPYVIPDTATAALGILLTVTIKAHARGSGGCLPSSAAPNYPWPVAWPPPETAEVTSQPVITGVTAPASGRTRRCRAGPAPYRWPGARALAPCRSRCCDHGHSADI